MKLLYSLFCIIFILGNHAKAAAVNNSWHFTLGYIYLNNVKEIKDSYRYLSKDAGDDNDIYNTSVNLSFQPYYQFFGGFRAGAGIGPLILLTGDAFHIQVPLNITVGYSFFMSSKISPYLKAGVSYPIAAGDFYAHSSPGFLGGIGFEIFKTESTHIGFETAYDSSAIKLDRASDQMSHETIKTGKITVYVYADF